MLTPPSGVLPPSISWAQPYHIRCTRCAIEVDARHGAFAEFLTKHQDCRVPTGDKLASQMTVREHLIAQVAIGSLNSRFVDQPKLVADQINKIVDAILLAQKV